MSGIKQINVVFTAEEHERLLKAKGEMSWHDFIMSLVESE